MGTFLFDKIVFGPVKSRRLGISLGINLLPNDSKFCNFNCIYCECGWSQDKLHKIDFHPRVHVKKHLEEKLQEMSQNNEQLDVITFAGNGEPTVHPEFEGIIEDTIEVRNRFFPKTKISVLSNSTMLHKKSVNDALLKVDNNILKLDSGVEETYKLLNSPIGEINLNKVIKTLIDFDGNMILQTMFVKGSYNGVKVDNTTDEEIEIWLDLIKKINPAQVMIYTIDRDTPAPDLVKVSIEDLNSIADKVRVIGYDVQVSG